MKKVIVITGESSGIGRATAIKLSKEGYPLLLVARNEGTIINISSIAGRKTFPTF
ncbi:SDR family NAD(P)-dependent oxidoreductase [Lutibacter sp. B2]|nr:SDR family NAD(P)-dependent oxidoreductase [Lutibacter sp. B2]